MWDASVYNDTGINESGVSVQVVMGGYKAVIHPTQKAQWHGESQGRMTLNVQDTLERFRSDSKDLVAGSELITFRYKVRVSGGRLVILESWAD